LILISLLQGPHPHLFAFLDAFCYLVTNRVSDMLIKKSLFERKETWIYFGHGFILVKFSAPGSWSVLIGPPG
jgi:hypothetical protein